MKGKIRKLIDDYECYEATPGTIGDIQRDMLVDRILSLIHQPKVSDEELAIMVSNAMLQDEHIAWDKREIKLLGEMIRAKYEAQ